MSRAFVRESDTGDALDLPERPVSVHPNLVTSEGLAAIDAEIGRLQARLAASGEDRASAASIGRDLRYWRARRASAQLTATPKDGRVHFGSRVTFEGEEGKVQTFRIVGEDEVDPAKGRISYLSPVARALLGKAIGDEVRAGRVDAEITAID